MILEAWRFRSMIKISGIVILWCFSVPSPGQEHLPAQQRQLPAAHSLLIRRDLTVINPVVVQALTADGVLLSDGSRIAWHEILVAGRWHSATDLSVDQLPDAIVQEHLRDYGQDWFTVLNRLHRRETLDVNIRLARLCERYQRTQEISVGHVAAQILLAKQLASEPERRLAVTTWLRSESLRRQLYAQPDWQHELEPWLMKYPIGLWDASEYSLGIPEFVPVFDVRVAADERELWRAFVGVPQAAIFELVSALESRDIQALQDAKQQLQISLRLWNAAQQPVLQHILKTVEEIQQWAADSGLAQRDDVRWRYLELEQEWLALKQVQPATEPSDLAFLDELTRRNQILWQLYFEGLYLQHQAEPQLNRSGLLRWMLLKQWASQAGELEANAVWLGSPVRNVLLGHEFQRQLSERISPAR